MNEAFETNGIWWLPVTPHIQVPGFLSYTPGKGLILKLMGALDKTQEKFFLPHEFINPDIILGISSKGDEVTLYRCFQQNGDSGFGNSGSYFNAEFFIHLAFFGAHFSTQTDIQFVDLSVRFHNLDSWYNKNCIQSTISETGIETLTFNCPTPIDIQLKDYQVQFALVKKQTLNLSSVIVSAEAWVHISAISQKSFEDYSNLLRRIQNFLTFVITEPTFVTEMNGRIIGKIEKTDGKFIDPINIRIFGPAVGWQPDAREIFWAFMLLPFSEIESNLPELLRVWVEKSESIKPVYDLYFAGFYRSTYPEDEFLNLTQALETFHRKIYGGQYQPDKVFHKGLYKTLVNAIPSDISDDFKNSLKTGKLFYAHEYSLKTRILLLFEHISEYISVSFLNDKRTREVFAKTIKDTRNYLTHYSPELKDKAVISGKGLYELNQQLRLILEICLLEQMEIPINKIRDIMKKERRYQRFLY
jgi:hypothetical protein